MTRNTSPASAKPAKKSPKAKPTRSKKRSKASDRGRVRIELSATALADLQRLSPTSARRIIRKLQAYREHPNPMQPAKPLIDSSIGEYRWRVGAYRVTFDRRAGTIFVLRIGHRKDIYE